MRHATDADHVLAVSTILDREPSLKKAAWVGVFWGIGHTLTILIFGGVIILFVIVIPNELALSLELVVAFMLIALGYWNLKGFKQWLRTNFDRERGNEKSGYVHIHAHRHGDYIHSHPHGHNPENHGHKEEEVATTWLDRKCLGGIGLFAGFRTWHHCRDDAHYCGHCHAVCLFLKKIHYL